jgi:hypothetical protein
MQKQSSRGGGWSCGGAGASGDHFRNRCGGCVAAPHIQHGSHQVANHVMQKTAAAYAIDEEIAVRRLLLMPAGVEDGSDGVFLRLAFLVCYYGLFAARRLVGVRRGKAEKVMRAYKAVRGIVQGGQGQRPGVRINVARQKRRGTV